VDGVNVEVTFHTSGYISYVTDVSLADEELVKGAPGAMGCSLGYDRISQRLQAAKNSPPVSAR
jgi:hypothetical protein